MMESAKLSCFQMHRVSKLKVFCDLTLECASTGFVHKVKVTISKKAVLSFVEIEVIVTEVRTFYLLVGSHPSVSALRMTWH